jgi:SAM-dependent methyltransferase
MRRLVLRSLSADVRRELTYIWAMQDAGQATGLDQYLIPQTLTQAALIFSCDWPRMVASFEWCDRIVSRTSPKSVVDMGCGSGFLLKYLLDRYPGIKVQGLDTAENLVRIGTELCETPLIARNYLTVEPDDAYELIICNFGFDLPNFTRSQKPHSSAVCAGLSYCPACSEHFRGTI